MSGGSRLAGVVVALALTGMTLGSAGTASAYPAKPHSKAAGRHAVPLASASITGTLQAGKWKKVLWGWGWYDVAYAASTSAPGGKADCYSAPNPWPKSYRLPATMWHSVSGYGDCWLYSPVNATYTLRPVTY